MIAKFGHLFVATLVAAFIFTVFILLSVALASPHATTSDMVYGRALRPYVYRTLLPSTVHVITKLTPASIRNDFNQSLAKTDLVRSIPDIYIIEDEYLYEITLVLILMIMSLVSFIYAMRYLTVGVFQIAPKTNNLVSLIAVLLLLQAFTYGYIYDFATLFLTTWAFGLFTHRRLVAFVLLFPFICLNKETAILLTIVYYVHFRNMDDRRTFYALLSLQLLTYFIIRAALLWAFRDNGGGSFEIHWAEHAAKYEEVLLGYPYLTLYYAVLFIGVPLLIMYQWDEKPLILKRSLIMFGPLFFLYLIFGYPFELRVFYEVYPIIFLLVFHSLVKLLGKTMLESS